MNLHRNNETINDSGVDMALKVGFIGINDLKMDYMVR